MVWIHDNRILRQVHLDITLPAQKLYLHTRLPLARLMAATAQASAWNLQAAYEMIPYSRPIFWLLLFSFILYVKFAIYLNTAPPEYCNKLTS
jgi:hypothetical protein